MRSTISSEGGQSVAIGLMGCAVVCGMALFVCTPDLIACCNDPPCGDGCYPTGDDYCYCQQQSDLLEEPQTASAALSTAAWGHGTFRTRGVDVEFGLGATLDGRPAGSLRLRRMSSGPTLASPEQLQFHPNMPGIMVQYNPGTNVIRQITTPEVLVDIEARYPYRGFYTIKFYGTSNWGRMDDIGLWHPLAGTEAVSWVIENPEREELVNQATAASLTQVKTGESWILPIDHLEGADDPGWVRYPRAGYKKSDAWGRSGAHDGHKVWWRLAGHGSQGDEPPSTPELYKIEFFQPTAGGGGWQPIETEFAGAEGDERFAYDPRIPWAGAGGMNHQYIGSEFLKAASGAWVGTGPGPHAPQSNAFDAGPDGHFMWLTRNAWLFAKWDFSFPVDRAWSVLRVTRVTEPVRAVNVVAEAQQNNHLRISKIIGSVLVGRYDYTETGANAWTLLVEDGVGNTISSGFSTSVEDASAQERVDIRQVIQGGRAIYQAVEIYKKFPFGDKLVGAEVTRYGTTSIVSRSHYDEVSDPRFGLLRSWTNPDGSWRTRDYRVFPEGPVGGSPAAAVTVELRGRSGTAMPDSPQTSVEHAFVYAYVPDIVLVGDEPWVSPREPRKISEFRNGIEVRTTYNAFHMEGRFKIKVEEKATPGSSFGDPHSIQKTIYYEPGSAGAGQPNLEDIILERLVRVVHANGQTQIAGVGLEEAATDPINDSYDYCDEDKVCCGDKCITPCDIDACEACDEASGSCEVCDGDPSQCCDHGDCTAFSCNADLDTRNAQMCPGGSADIILFIENTSACPATFAWSVTKDAGAPTVTISPSSGSMALIPGEVDSVIINVTADSSSPTGTCSLKAEVSVNGVVTCNATGSAAVGNGAAPSGCAACDSATCSISMSAVAPSGETCGSPPEGPCGITGAADPNSQELLVEACYKDCTIVFSVHASRDVQAGVCPGNFTELPQPGSGLITADTYCAFAGSFNNTANNGCNTYQIGGETACYSRANCIALHEAMHLQIQQLALELESSILCEGSGTQAIPVTGNPPSPTCEDARSMRMSLIQSQVERVYFNAALAMDEAGEDPAEAAARDCFFDVARSICQWAQDDPNIDVDACAVCAGPNNLGHNYHD
jgi:hypothetical protein